MADTMYIFEKKIYSEMNFPAEKMNFPDLIDPSSQSINPPSPTSPMSATSPTSPTSPTSAKQAQIDFNTMFPVLVKTDTQTLTFMWNNDTSIEKMFIVTSEAFSRPADSFYLIFNGKKLHSSSLTLKEMNIVRNASILCIFKMRGGMLTESSGRAGGYKLL